MAATPIGPRPGDMPVGRDPATAAAIRKTPLATVTIGIDAVVGGTAADFVEVSSRDPKPLSSPVPRPQSASTALVLRRKTGEVRAIQPFAQEMIDVVEPVRSRLLDEAARLDSVRRAALDYVSRPETGREVES